MLQQPQLCIGKSKICQKFGNENAHHGKLFARATTGCLSDMSSFMHFA